MQGSGLLGEVLRYHGRGGSPVNGEEELGKGRLEWRGGGRGRRTEEGEEVGTGEGGLQGAPGQNWGGTGRGWKKSWG